MAGIQTPLGGRHISNSSLEWTTDRLDQTLSAECHGLAGRLGGTASRVPCRCPFPPWMRCGIFAPDGETGDGGRAAAGELENVGKFLELCRAGAVGDQLAPKTPDTLTIEAREWCGRAQM